MTAERRSPEHALVVNCVHPEYDSRARERTRTLLRRGLEWERIYEIAKWHQIRPLVYERLHASNSPALPNAILSRLRDDSRTIARRNLLAGTQLESLCDRLDAVGIRAVPFKGPVLARRIYRNTSHREFLDIDLLVPKRAISATLDELERSGYTWEFDAPRHDDGVVLGSRFTYPLYPGYVVQHESHPFQIDVRWQIGERLAPFAIDFDTLWEQGSSASLPGETIRKLNSIDRLLVLTYHGTKHLWARLKWLVDVAWLVNRQRLHWDRLLRKARRFDTERRLLLGLGLVRALFDVELPSTVVELIARSETVSDQIDQTIEWVFQRRPSVNHSWERWRYVTRNNKGVQKLALLRLLQPGIKEYLQWPLPRKYHAFYYLLRPARLLLTGVRGCRDRTVRKDGGR